MYQIIPKLYKSLVTLLRSKHRNLFYRRLVFLNNTLSQNKPSQNLTDYFRYNCKFKLLLKDPLKRQTDCFLKTALK